MLDKFGGQLCLRVTASPQQTNIKTACLLISLNTYPNRFLPVFRNKLVSNAADKAYLISVWIQSKKVDINVWNYTEKIKKH